jgi:SAM-dependent methyltransferase
MPIGGPLRPSERAATLGRSVRLFRAFGREQSAPAEFYRPLAADSVAQLSGYVPLDTGPDGTLVLDVGGGPGWFAEAFDRAGARYATVEADEGEFAGSLEGAGRVLATALRLPFADDSVDVCYSSNVLEHVPQPWTMTGEMLRVTRPGGTVVVGFTTWYGPWGGHETAPWHLVSGPYAARRYARRHGRPPKNRYGESLFPVTVRQALRWARTQQAADVVRVLPRYHPWWSWWVLRVPVLRELVTWNLVLVLRKRP